MKIELPKYPAYKSSGVPWMGEIPSSWNRLKLRYLAKQRGGGTPSKAKPEYWRGDIPWVSPKDMKFEVIDDAEDHITADALSDSASSLVDANSVLMVVRSGILRRCIPVAINAVPVALNQDMKAFIPNLKLRPSFLLLLILGNQEEFLSLWLKRGSTVESLELPLISDTVLPLPPLCEQDAIVTFIDRETSKIDRLMAVRRKQVERLQEQRTAIIHHAVTKGLDPQAEMKPSGVESLGAVPEGWSVMRLKYVAKCNGMTLGEQTAADYLIDYIDIGNVTSAGEVLEIQPFEFQSAPSRARRKLAKGATIISTVRTYLKAIAFFEDPADNLIVSTGFAVLESFGDVRARFLYYALASEYFIQRVIAESKGVGYPAINASDLINIVIAFPENEAEQDQILAHIDRETTKLDTLITKYQRELELLAEYRASLISHAVTGKIDVRGLVDPAP